MPNWIWFPLTLFVSVALVVLSILFAESGRSKTAVPQRSPTVITNVQTVCDGHAGEEQILTAPNGDVIVQCTDGTVWRIRT